MIDKWEIRGCFRRRERLFWVRKIWKSARLKTVGGKNPLPEFWRGFFE